MYLLPKENLAMNKIVEYGCSKCDIYTDLAIDNSKQQIEDFLRLMEVHICKMKRLQNRRARVRFYCDKLINSDVFTMLI